MDIQAKRKELTQLVDNIKEHSDRLTVSHTLPALELSVLISKIAKLYEETIILKHEISKMELTEIEKLPMNQNSKGIKNDAPTADVPVSIVKEDEQKVAEISLDTDSNNAESESIAKPVSNEIAEEVTKETNSFSSQDISEVKSISKYEIDFQDLNTKLSGKEENSVVDQLQKQPIADLTTAIGLNERYLYANELFGGSMELFRDALRALNSKGSLQDALDYLENDLVVTHQWSNEHDLVHSLRRLVERRFN